MDTNLRYEVWIVYIHTDTGHLSSAGIPASSLQRAQYEAVKQLGFYAGLPNVMVTSATITPYCTYCNGTGRARLESGRMVRCPVCKGKGQSAIILVDLPVNALDCKAAWLVGYNHSAHNEPIPYIPEE
jgi:hypothetical protein